MDHFFSISFGATPKFCLGLTPGTGPEGYSKQDLRVMLRIESGSATCKVMPSLLYYLSGPCKHGFFTILFYFYILVFLIFQTFGHYQAF